jgi:hypothetical protein
MQNARGAAAVGRFRGVNVECGLAKVRAAGDQDQRETLLKNNKDVYPASSGRASLTPAICWIAPQRC